MIHREIGRRGVFSGFRSPRLPISLCILLLCCSAHADQDRARELGRAGLTLYEAGDWTAAYDKFAAARAEHDAPTLLLYMARCQRNLGKLLEAQRLYEELAAQPLPPDAPPQFVEARAAAKAEQADVAQRLALAERPPPPPPPPPPGPEPDAEPGPIWPALAAFGLAGAAAIVGTGTGMAAALQTSDIRDQCIDDACPVSLAGDADDARTLATTSTVSYVIAGVAAAGGVVLVIVRPGAEKQAALDLWLRPVDAAVRVRF